MSARRWTRAELEELDELVAQGQDDHVIGLRLRRTTSAVEQRRKIARIGCVSKRTLSARRVAGLMGRAPDAVTYWCQRRFLDATRSVRRGPGRQWFITEDALLAFLENPNYWPAWSPSDITDLGLREWATELRAGHDLVSVGELAKRYCVSADTAGHWLRVGLLPSIKFMNHYVFERDLAGFVPPYAGWRRGGRGRLFTAEEDARLLALRAEGRTWEAIGREMGRALASVHRRHRWLCQPTPMEESA